MQIAATALIGSLTVALMFNVFLIVPVGRFSLGIVDLLATSLFGTIVFFPIHVGLKRLARKKESPRKPRLTWDVGMSFATPQERIAYLADEIALEIAMAQEDLADDDGDDGARA